MLFTSVAIGQSNYFGVSFTTLNWKPLYYTTNYTTVQLIPLDQIITLKYNFKVERKEKTDILKKLKSYKKNRKREKRAKEKQTLRFSGGKRRKIKKA